MGQSKTYALVDPEKLTAKIQQLGGPAIDATKPIGTALAHGCQLQWLITGSNITITVLSKPFYVSYGQVWNALGELFSGAL